MFTPTPETTLADKDACPTCGRELLWDTAERINYCLNDWEHG